MSKAAVAADPFVPFGPSTLAAKSGTPNLRVVPKDGGAEAFSPFQASAGGHAHGAGGAGAGQPSITLQKEGDKVVGIRVECACGQVIEMACSY